MYHPPQMVHPTVADAVINAIAARSLLRQQGAVVASGRWREIARPAQIHPEGDWRRWVFMAGRKSGKTRGHAEWCHEQVRSGKRRGALVARTSGDVRDVMIEGESGLIATCPADLRPIIYKPSLRKVIWGNGSIAHVFPSEEPARLRGPIHDFLWGDEIAWWKYLKETYDNAMTSLVLGSDPRAVFSTTPRPLKLLKEIVADPATVVTTATMYDNADSLAPEAIADLERIYKGTVWEKQELLGRMLMEVPGAIWTLNGMDELRMNTYPDMKRIVVAVDPSVSAGESSAECGIIVAGKGDDDHGYVLDDVSGRVKAEVWAKRAVKAYYRWEADCIVAEVNNGGDLVESVIRAVDSTVKVKKVTASRGKYVRAEPVAALYDQGKVHHVGAFPELEDQMIIVTPEGADDLVDRADALVWAITELMLRKQATWGAA